MKKTLMAVGLINFYIQENSFLGREDCKVFTAATTDALLKVHREEKVDLIVTTLDMPGLFKLEQLFDTIRQREELQKVSTILICEDTIIARERAGLCGANAVFTLPVDTTLLHDKMRQLLDVSPRQSYRAMLQIVGIDGKLGDRAFLCRAENISATGILITAQEILSQGDHIFLSLFLPNGVRVDAPGEIVRVSKQMTASHVFRYGVRFTGITPQAASAIEDFVKKTAFESKGI